MSPETPVICPTCGALPCDWAAGASEEINALAVREAERDEDRANINLKADFIDKTLNQLGRADEKIARLCEALRQIIAAPLIDHSDSSRSAKAIAIAALKAEGSTIRELEKPTDPYPDFDIVNYPDVR